MRIIALVLMLLPAFTLKVMAAPANPEYGRRYQPDGSAFMARSRGDEFFGWHETDAGYPIEQNNRSGWWTYRRQPGDTNVIDLVVGRDQPPGKPWTPEPTKIAVAAREQLGHQVGSRLPVMNGRGTRAVGEGGTAKLLTACVRFTDSPAAGSLTPTSYFQQMIYGRTANRRTVADYYYDVSGGMLSITGEVRGWLTMAQNTAYYGTNQSGIISAPRIVNLISNTVQSLNAGGLNFGDYDSDRDGFVDCLAIVFQGLGEADGGSETTIWPHQSTYSQLNNAGAGSAGLPTGDVNANGQPVFVDLYFTAAELNRNSSNMSTTVSAPIGTFCHEFAHALGLPDLYDTVAPVSRGVGDWSLMAYGTYANGYGQAGDCPTWIDPYNRIKAGWETPVNVTENMIGARIPEVHHERKIFRMWTSGALEHEYFLIEYRKRIGFNIGQPGEGLLIYHIDESVTTQNDREWWKTLASGSRISRGNFLVALEQADGLFEMERAIDKGDADDPYRTGSEFVDYTTPNSKAYNDPGTYSEGPSTAVAVKNINTYAPEAATADLFVFEDQYPPSVSIAEPGNGMTYESLTNAFGFAYDSGELAGISAKLQEQKPGGRFFDWISGTWVSSFGPSCEAQLGTNNNWTLAINDSLLQDGSAYALAVTARDIAGMRKGITNSFVINRSLFTPSIMITSPNGQTYAEPPLIQGWSSTPESTELTARRFALYSESSNAWYNWSSGTLTSSTFDFATHVYEVAGNELDWNYALPTNLISGYYQIHAQSLNNSNRASAWLSRQFRLARAPTVNITSHSHQSLLKQVTSIYGNAMPKSGYTLDGFVRLTIYREGQYWTGTYWTNTQATILALIDASGGDWIWPGPGNGDVAFPADDGLYAISASVIDNFGSVSLPVAGGQYEQNNILLQIDNTPPEITITWPPVGYTSTASRITHSFSGSATDRSGQPLVRGFVRRVSDDLYWSVYGWAFGEQSGLYNAHYPGGDGGSFSGWVLDPGLPDAGFNTAWCMPNGQYELIAVAYDKVGNSNRVTRVFEVNYQSPLFANLPTNGFSSVQSPANTNLPVLVGATSVPPFSTSAELPTQWHQLLPVSNGVYRLIGSKLEYLGYGASSIDPIVYAAGPSGKINGTSITNAIEDAPSYFYARSAGAPLNHFRSDGAGATANELMDFKYGNWIAVSQAHVIRHNAAGGILWQSIVPPTNYTGWVGSADKNGLNIKWIKLLDDGRVVLIAELFGVQPSYFGDKNFRNHVLCMILNNAGQVVSVHRFGQEIENEFLQENEYFVDAELDGAGNLFVATRRNIAGGQRSHYLRKIRLSDNALTGEYVIDLCTSDEWWSAITVDAAGWIFIGATVVTGDGQTRLLVTRINPVSLGVDWRAYGPAGSGGHKSSLGVPADMPLLQSINGSVYVVHNHDGTDEYSANDDRIYATRFDPSGKLLWCRELPGLNGVAFSGNRADVAALTPSGDILLTGDFGFSGTATRGYAKFAANGDLQFARALNLTTMLAVNRNADATRIAVAIDGGVTGQVSIVELSNPSNVYPVASSGYTLWAYQQSLSGSNSLPGSVPAGDGVANLIRYAFNMGAWDAATRMASGIGTSGLPDMRTAGTGTNTKLRVEYLRRRNDTNLTYQVQFSSNVAPDTAWQNAISTGTPSTIDSNWERVVVEDHVSASTTTQRFSRVRVGLKE